jgi:hypothetical protein
MIGDGSQPGCGCFRLSIFALRDLAQSAAHDMPGADMTSALHRSELGAASWSTLAAHQLSPIDAEIDAGSRRGLTA